MINNLELETEQNKMKMINKKKKSLEFVNAKFLIDRYDISKEALIQKKTKNEKNVKFITYQRIVHIRK